MNELNKSVADGEFTDIDLNYHEEWLPLPLQPGVDLPAWSQDTAAELMRQAGKAGVQMDSALLTQELRERAADSRSRGPIYAFALCLPGIDRVGAMLEIDLIHPDEKVPEVTLDWIVETFSAHDFGPPDTQQAMLPAGPAVRIRQNFAASSDVEGDGQVVLETITYGVRPQETRSAIVMFVSWTVPGVSDLVERMADDVAQTLSVTIGSDGIAPR